jgi:hypothetical protein
VHPVAAVLVRPAATVALLVKLIEVAQLDLELQRYAALAARQRHQQPGTETVRWAASSSRWMKSIAR